MKVKIYKLTFILCLFLSLSIQAQEFEWQVEPILKYEWLGEFQDGIIKVRIGNYKNGKWGAIDKNGNIIIEVKYDKIGNLSDGLIRVKINNKYKFLNNKGKLAIPLKYEDAHDFSNGLAEVKLHNESSFININGAKVDIDCNKYGDIWSFSEDRAAVKLKDRFKWGFIDRNGNEICPIKYDNFMSFSGGIATIKIGDKYGIIDKNGNEILEPRLQYDWTNPCDGNLIIVKLNDKYGFIDIHGNVIVPPKYKIISCFSEGLAKVKLNNKYGYINIKGKEVIDIKYDLNNSFSEGLAVIKLNGKYGYIDKNGYEVIKPQFEKANSFSGGLACVKINGKWGIIKNPLLYQPKPLNLPTTYALAVGIKDYNLEVMNDLGKLESTDRAPQAFKTVLTRSLYLSFENVQTLTNNEATKSTIISKLQKVANQTSKQDVLIFYFAGHGAVERKTSDKYGVYTYDSKPHKSYTLLKYTEIFDIMAKSTAKHKIIIIDACGSGAVTMGLPDAEEVKSYQDYQEELVRLDKSFILISSTKAGQEGYDGANLPFFTKYLLEGLEGKASKNKIITIQEAFEYAKEKTEESSGNAQNPQMIFKEGFDKNFPFIVVPKKD